MQPVISIQYLRAIAAMLVLVLHAAYKESVFSKDVFSFSIGNTGVDIFFIISGFIMAYTFNDQLSAGRFLWRRVLRVMPIYWLTTSVALLGYLLFPQFVNGGRESAIVSSFLLTPSELPYLNQNGWTLSYEFLFYGVFSLAFLIGIGKYRQPAVFALLLLLPIIGHIVNGLGITIGVWGDFLFDTIVIEFALGLVLLFIYNHFKLSTTVKPVIISVSFFIAMIGYFKPAGIPDFNIRVLDLGIPSFFLCLSLLALEPVLKKRPSQLLLNLGNSSYSLYLVHAFVLSGGSVILNSLNLTQSSFLFITLLIVLSILAGECCYYLLERPLARVLSKYK